MKIKLLAALLFMSLILFSFKTAKIETIKAQKPLAMYNDSLLRHIVLFKFKDNTPKVKEIEMAFHELQVKIPQILRYE